MHLAIACLEVSTPVACVTYQDKFDGLFRLFGLLEINGLVLTPKEAIKPGAIYQTARRLLSQEAAIRKTVKRRLPTVKKLALKNLA
jgi:polysaccharide pyruvyl transferase WcaK-like protein